MSYAVVAADPPATANAVAERSSCDCDGKDFEHHMTRPGVHLFTAGWCPHCQQMDKDMNNENYNSPHSRSYYKHDYAIMPEQDKITMNENFNVKGFPTIYFVKRNSNGELIKERWKGKRTKEAIDAAYQSFLEDGKKE